MRTRGRWPRLRRKKFAKDSAGEPKGWELTIVTSGRRAKPPSHSTNQTSPTRRIMKIELVGLSDRTIASARDGVGAETKTYSYLLSAGHRSSTFQRFPSATRKLESLGCSSGSSSSSLSMASYLVLPVLISATFFREPPPEGGGRRGTCSGEALGTEGIGGFFLVAGIMVISFSFFFQVNLLGGPWRSLPAPWMFPEFLGGLFG